MMLIGTVDPDSAYYCFPILGYEVPIATGSYEDGQKRVQGSNPTLFQQTAHNIFRWIADSYFPQERNEEGVKAYSYGQDYVLKDESTI